MGKWALNYLLIALSMTPFRKLTGWNVVGRLRRMLELYAFLYAALHFLISLVFEHFFDCSEIVKDIAKRPYVTVGFSAFTLLIPLTMTSTNTMVRRLGGQRWKRLHSMVYVIGARAILHFFWLVKADIREPLIYGAILSLLLAMRLPVFS